MKPKHHSAKNRHSKNRLWRSIKKMGNEKDIFLDIVLSNNLEPKHWFSIKFLLRFKRFGWARRAISFFFIKQDIYDTDYSKNKKGFTVWVYGEEFRMPSNFAKHLSRKSKDELRQLVRPS